MNSKNKKNKRTEDWIPATLSEFDGVRFLHLDSIWVQGAMRIRKPQVLELDYIQRMMIWMLWRESAELTEGQAVQLGLGAAAITRFCHKVLRMKTTAVEINPTVIAACRSWFHLPEDDERLTVVNMDAERWLRDAEPQQASVLNVDLYDHDAASPVLDDEAFYASCRALLAPGGLMTVNLFGRNSSFARSATRIARVFGADQVWTVAPTKEGNTVVVAGRDVVAPGREELERRAANIEQLYGAYGLPARKWMRLVRPLPLSIAQKSQRPEEGHE